MTLEQLTADRQLRLDWEAPPPTKQHHTDEWVKGSAVSAGITELAIESIEGVGAVLGFLNPQKLGRAGRAANAPHRYARAKYASPILGGWLAYSHQPLNDGQFTAVSFKPDHPRLKKGKPVKYDRPEGSPLSGYFTPLTAEAVEVICTRAGIAAPAFQGSWDSWLWLLAQPEVELFIDEGEKKAAAACSHGFLTIGLGGIWNGCPRPKDSNGNPFGSHTLIADLQWLKQVRPAGSPLTIAFDASEKPTGRIAVRKARRTLGKLLEADGHVVSIREIVQPKDATSFVKGTDDLLVAGGAEALSALPVVALQAWLDANSKQAIQDHLLHPFRTEDRRHRTIDRHFKATDIPRRAPLIALVGGMGSNKTGAVADLARGVKLNSITHRRSLADNQGHRFGLGVKREGKLLYEFGTSAETSVPASKKPVALEPESGASNALESKVGSAAKHPTVDRLVSSLLAEEDGCITVADSSYVGGTGELKPDECRDAVLFIDEADAFLRHCLTAATAIKDHRCEVLKNLAACVKAAEQVVLAGAHIDETTLRSFEAMRGNGCKAHVIESTLKPAEGRDLTIYRKKEQLLQQLRNLATDRQPFLFHTGSKEDSSKFSPASLAKKIRDWWPDARILELSSDTTTDPNDAAAAAIQDPQRLLEFDVVLATPVLETGFSIEDRANHFKAVLAHTSGHTMPHAFVQSIGRLRSNAPRHIWCNSSGSRVANGSPVATEIERTKLDHANLLTMLHLHGVDDSDALDHQGDGTDADVDCSKFAEIWCRLAADQNWLGGHYRHAVATLLEAEGYAVERLDIEPSTPCTGSDLSDELAEARDAVVAEETTAVAATPAPTAEQLEELETKQRLTKQQRRMIERGRLARDLGLQQPTAEQVAVSRKQSSSKFKQHLLMVDSDYRQRAQKQIVQGMTPSQRRFAPDATKAMAPITRATVMSQMRWLSDLLGMVGNGETITMDAFAAPQAQAKTEGRLWRELFGFDPGGGCTARTFVSNMLKLLGFKLQRTTRRSRDAEGRRWWHYEVVDELKTLNRSQVHATMREALQ